MKNFLEDWLDEKGAQFVRTVGVKGGNTVIDFGCGEGWYTVPIAQVAGPRGRVYAIEKKQDAFEEMIALVKARGLNNVTGIRSAGEMQLPLADRNADAVFTYDVLHHIGERDLFFNEVHRVLKTGGIFSLYPACLMHPDKLRLSVIEKEIAKTGLSLSEKKICKVLHRGKMVEDYLLKYINK